jgi:hypothetical protein
MTTLKTCGLSKIPEVASIVKKLKDNYNVHEYSYENILSELALILKALKEKGFIEMRENTLLSAFNSHNLYVDVITYAVIEEYQRNSFTRELPIHVYLSAIIARPFLYNIIICNMTNDKLEKFKSDLLSFYNMRFRLAASERFTKIQKLLTTNETPDAQRVSSLALFKYFVDCSFNAYAKPYSNFNAVFVKDATYIVVHLSYNIENIGSLFAYKRTDTVNSISLDQKAIECTNYINEFRATRHAKPYEVVNSTGSPCELSDRNIFVLCYDNSVDIRECTFNVCKFYGHNEMLTKAEAQDKLNGIIYHSYNIDDIYNYIKIDNTSKVFDAPEKYDEISMNAAYVQCVHLVNKNINTFMREFEKVNTVLSPEELDYFKIYVKGLPTNNKNEFLNAIREFLLK